jgi:hypothetical protein
MPVVDGLPGPERGRHVPPRDTTAGPPKHPVKDRAVIRPSPTPTRGLVGQQRFQPGPFLVGQIMTMQHRLGLPHPMVKIRGTRSNALVCRSLPVAVAGPWGAGTTPVTSGSWILRCEAESIDRSFTVAPNDYRRRCPAARGATGGPRSAARTRAPRVRRTSGRVGPIARSPASRAGRRRPPSGSQVMDETGGPSERPLHRWS